VLNPVVIAEAVYSQSSSRAIARNHENTAQQFRSNSLILPSPFNSDRDLTQEWTTIVHCVQLSRTA